MAEDKPGFFKRLFKFGKKGREEEEAARAAAEAERMALEKAAAEASEQERLKAEADRKAADDEAQAAVEAAAAEAAKEAIKAEQELARQQAADELAEKEAKATKEKADRLEIAKAELARIEAQKLEAKRLVEERKNAEARQTAENKDRLVAEKAVAEEKARLEREQAEADEASRVAAEKQEQEAERNREVQRLAEQEQAASSAAAPALPDGDEIEPPVSPESGNKKSWFKRLRAGLSRSSNQLSENISSVFTKRKLDDETLQDLEDILIQADMGVETAMNITEALAAQRMGKDVTGTEVREFMAGEIEKVLKPVARELELDLDHTPHVILVVGVNGSGKTTTIGKLSQKLYDAGFSTLLVAGDTFRAAAIEQLKIWGERTQSPVVFRPLGSDAAGLAYDAYARAVDEGRDVMLMDTAGRLQNKKELMAELEKIVRVLKKQDPTAPHTVLLTLDATTGQNALNQVEIFKDIAGVNGLVMTKLDGTARGGIMVAIASRFKLPVYFIGVGEQVDDLEPFEARDFARSIAGLEQ